MLDNIIEVQTQQVTVMNIQNIKKMTLRFVNAERNRNHTDRLIFHFACARKAQDHAYEMRRLRYFGHVSPAGRDWNYGGLTPECCAMLYDVHITQKSDFAIASKIVHIWKNSPPHHHAILTASGYGGMGIAYGSGRLYAVIQMTWKPEHIAYHKQWVAGGQKGVKWQQHNHPQQQRRPQKKSHESTSQSIRRVLRL